jgi:hypothetical protein
MNNQCQWILIDCVTGRPYPCGVVINGVTLNCNCYTSTGGYISCP